MAAQLADDLPEEVQSWIGQERYTERTEFPIEMGYVLTTLSATQNGNPLYWDPKVAAELTDGPITLPTMVSVWFRPHDWSPGRTEPRVVRSSVCGTRAISKPRESNAATVRETP